MNKLIDLFNYWVLIILEFKVISSVLASILIVKGRNALI